MRRKLGRLLAWCVTLGVLAYVFSSVSPAALGRALATAAPWTVPVLAALVVVVYFADALAISRTFGWFLARLSFREVLVVRGATYLLALINYALGQGAIVYFLHRARGVPLLRGSAAVLLVMGVNLLLLLLLASVGLAVTSEVPGVVKTMVAVAYAGLGVYVALQIAKPRWLASRALFEVLLGAGLAGHLKAIAVRLPHLASLVFFSWVSLRAFRIEVPLAHAILLLPVVYFVAVLPISVQGWGPTQWAMITLFARYAPGDDPRAVVFAASLTGQVVALAVQAVIGLFCLRHHLARDLVRAPATAPVSSPASAP